MRLEAPGEALLTDPCAVRIVDVEPSAVVVVAVTCDYGPAPDGSPRRWRSTATFEADSSGVVEVADQGPIGGDWVGDASGRGPWWSATHLVAEGRTEPADGIEVSIEASTGDAAASATWTRRRAATPVETVDGTADRCRLRTYRPVSGLPRTGLVVVGGSEGGMPFDAGWTFLASLGCAVCTVEYFGGPGLPAALDAVPVEVALDAADELARLEADGRVAVLGISRGSELALLAAAAWPDRFGAAVAVLGSGVANVGLSAEGPTGRSAWTLDGDPVPFFDTHRADGEIAVERIAGPVLSYAAADDQLWNSVWLLEPAIARRTRAPHPGDRHRTFAGAGHGAFGYPGIPVADPSVGVVHPVTGETMTFGGTRLGDAIARDRIWADLPELLLPGHAQPSSLIATIS